MLTEFELLQLEKNSGILSAIWSFLIIYVANWSQDILIQQQYYDTNSTEGLYPSTITPSELTLFALAIPIICSAISIYTTRERLRQRRADQASGKDTASLSPNILTNIGAALGLISLITTTLGVKQKVNQEAQITIL